MFNGIKHMLGDIRVINALSLEAERQARLAGLQQPGAEHYLLAALALEEGSARRALASAGATPANASAAGVRAAIAAQHQAALAKAGIAGAGELDESDLLHTPPPRLFDAAASGKAVVQALPTLRRAHGNAGLRGAHVLLAIATMPNSTAARSLVHMGVDLDTLAKAAAEALRAPADSTAP